MYYEHIDFMKLHIENYQTEKTLFLLAVYMLMWYSIERMNILDGSYLSICNGGFHSIWRQSVGNNSTSFLKIEDDSMGTIE